LKAAPYLISETNLSHAWGRVLWRAAKSSGPDLQPLLVTITGFGTDGAVQEDDAIRTALDDFLAKKEQWSVEIVAFTIFPRRYLLVSGGDRHEFYQICMDALPHLKAQNPVLNGRGFYFERLISFGRGAINPNQLEFILSEHSAGRKRTSALQASIYDPERDQSRQPYQTFPCLQTISFVPTEAGLVVNAFYAMQYLMKRGYGNFLGLSHLGAFMAREMKVPLARLNVIAGVERLDFPKQELAALLDIIQQRIKDLDPAV
jgi:hypothetical protein